jgi:hypothetical protein
MICRAPRVSHFRSSASRTLVGRSATTAGSWSALGSAAMSSAKYTDPSSGVVRGQNRCWSPGSALSSLWSEDGQRGEGARQQRCLYPYLMRSKISAMLSPAVLPSPQSPAHYPGHKAEAGKFLLYHGGWRGRGKELQLRVGVARRALFLQTVEQTNDAGNWNC